MPHRILYQWRPCLPCHDTSLFRFEQGTSTRGSEDSFATGRRDRVGTKAEKELTRLFERWLNSTTLVLRAAIFGDDTVICWLVSFCVRFFQVESLASSSVPRLSLEILHALATSIDKLVVNKLTDFWLLTPSALTTFVRYATRKYLVRTSTQLLGGRVGNPPVRLEAHRRANAAMMIHCRCLHQISKGGWRAFMRRSLT